MNPFEYTNPLFHDTEYHIKLDRTLYAKNYKENHPNHNNLWDDVELCIKNSEYDSYILSYNYDWDNEDKLYMYLHFHKKEIRDIIKNIINLLNEKFNNEWLLYCTIPKLTSLIVLKFKNEKYLLDSICEHQRIHGYLNTKAKIDFYLNTIKPLRSQHL